MLSRRPLLDRDGITIEDVACRHGHGRGREVEHATGHALVFVRRGWFVRSADGDEALMDPTVAYCANPGEEQRFDHPQAGGDDCLAVGLVGALVASLWGGEPQLPSGPLAVAPAVDLQHRLLLRGGDPDELFERAIALAAGALAAVDRRRVASGRPATERARRALADGAREALAADCNRSLPQLARELAVSPHHLSRVFRAFTGHTISRHRMRLRTRHVLHRLAGGDHDLARLAADLGFADQSHLCRVVRAETGHTPAALRRALG
jgi:AraC-like DNA-binding protein